MTGIDLRPEEQRARAVLIAVPGLGPMRADRLLKAFGSAELILQAPARHLVAVKGISETIIREMHRLRSNQNQVQPQERSSDASRFVLCTTDSAYPSALKSIYAAPPFLWATGGIENLNRRCVAVVGTRRPSNYGKSMAYSLSYELAANGITVVSGLAYGIDATAHDAALNASGQTIAVLGSGLDHLYPARHKQLAERIRNSGALLSEFPLRTSARPGHFPRRNRIISGLADATIVVEAYEQGGALLTAKIALDQDRDVFAVPGQIGNPAAAGVNKLIQKGEAQLLTSVSDLFTDKQGTPALSESSQEESGLMTVLTESPIHIDDLSTTCGLPTQDVLIELMRLECTGQVRQLPGKYYVRGTT